MEKLDVMKDLEKDRTLEIDIKCHIIVYLVYNIKGAYSCKP